MGDRVEQLPSGPDILVRKGRHVRKDPILQGPVFPLAVEENALDPENGQIGIRFQLRANGFQDPRAETVVAVKKVDVSARRQGDTGVSGAGNAFMRAGTNLQV